MVAWLCLYSHYGSLLPPHKGFTSYWQSTPFPRQALDVAQKLIHEYDQQDKCMPWKALAAGSMIAKAQAATELLATARERFCQAIVTGKALGELAAERVARTQAEQAGERPPAGYVLLGRGGKRVLVVPFYCNLVRHGPVGVVQYSVVLRRAPSCRISVASI